MKKKSRKTSSRHPHHHKTQLSVMQETGLHSQAPREANKTCAVCGDRALGCNFNAITCESCKAFFRRNALKNKDFRCPFSENCNVNPVTRRFCQKCRLDKCFNIGMKKELIMSEEDKVLKRKKIELNRAKKRPGSDSFKGTKSKRESIDDVSFDDTSTSIPSVTSITSGVSEPYFWESEKKYTDLDIKKQPAIDNMSPVTAASVPSPSSPPDNCDIIGTKTLDMLKQSAQMSIQNFEMDDRSVSYSPLDLNIEKNFSSQINFDTNSSNAFEHEKEQSTFAKMNDSNTASRQLTSGKLADSSLRCVGLENYIPKSNQHQNTLYPECLSSNTKFIESCVNQVTSNIQPNTEETIACQKSQETCSKDSTNPSSNTIQNPELVSKLIQNPNVIAKIIQDQNVLAKFTTDPVIVNKLLTDPEFSHLFQQNTATNSDQEMTKKFSFTYNGILNNKIECCKNQVKNPILTNLITTHNTKDHESQNTGNISNEHKKINDVTKDIFQDIQREPVSPNTLESILCEAIKLEYSPYSTLNSIPSSRELNDAERAKLNELIVANKALLAPLEEDITNLVGDGCNLKEHSGKNDPKLLGVINLTATAIRRLIKMSKKISAFKNMCQEDQLALLKGGCTEMMILRSAINYDPDKETWDIPHSTNRMANIKVDVLKEANNDLYNEHKKFIRTFDSCWREENIILILSAIALFSPERPRVVHSDVIKLEQNSYYYLLRRYLESIYPGCEAKTNFLKLIQKMLELHRLNKEVVEVYLNVNPSSVEPLLIEIFDLKH